jgi:hypothetical protein
MQHTLQSQAALLEQFGDAGKPCCFVGANGEFREANDEFQTLLGRDIIRFSGPNRKISMTKGMKVTGLNAWEDHDLVWHDGPGTMLRVEASSFEPDPRFSGRREKLWLLTVGGYSKDLNTVTPAVDLRALTTQEVKLYQAVVNGSSVADAGAIIGVKRSRAFEIWSSIKEKPNISNAHQVRRVAAE